MSFQRKEQISSPPEARAGRSSSPPEPRVIFTPCPTQPSVGRFKNGDRVLSSLDLKGPPSGVKTTDSVARSIAPQSNHGIFTPKETSTTRQSLTLSWVDCWRRMAAVARHEMVSSVDHQ